MSAYYPSGCAIPKYVVSDLFYAEETIFGTKTRIHWEEFFRLLPGTIKAMAVDKKYRHDVIDAWRNSYANPNKGKKLNEDSQ